MKLPTFSYSQLFGHFLSDVVNHDAEAVASLPVLAFQLVFRVSLLILGARIDKTSEISSPCSSPSARTGLYVIGQQTDFCHKSGSDDQPMYGSIRFLSGQAQSVFASLPLGLSLYWARDI
jgi:hypothetical protein